MRNKGEKLLSILHVTTILLFIISTTLAGFPNEPHPGNAMWIEDADAPYWAVNLTTANPQHTIGYRFNITIWLNMTNLQPGATGIDTWQVKLYFDKNYLKALRAGYTEGTQSQLFKGLATVPVTPIIDNNAGYVFHGETCVAGSYKLVPCSGSLFWIEFNVTKVPSPGETLTSQFNINNPDTAIVDNEGNVYPPNQIIRHNGYYQFKSVVEEYTLSITSTTGGTTNPPPGTYLYTSSTTVQVTAIPNAGYKFSHWELDGSNVGASNPIEVIMDSDHTLHAIFIEAPPLGTILYVDPPEIIDPNMVPSSTFHINITIDDVENLLICEFNLTYKTAILSWVNVRVLKVQNQIPTSKLICDDDMGFIWVKLTYKTSITTTTPLALMDIEFHVDTMGLTPLDLTDTKLTDPSNKEIPHTTMDGVFFALLQDLAIVSVVLSNAQVYVSQPVNINVTVKNLGNQAESFDVKVYYDDELIDIQHVTNLPPDTENELTFTWDTSRVEPCKNYTIKAEVTVLPYEQNTADNTYVDGTVQVLIRDIAIINVVPSCTWTYQGWLVNITATAKNLGNQAESFDVKVYYDDELIDIQHVTNLPPGEEINLTFIWNTSSVKPCHSYTITGKATMLPWEFNATNNNYIDGTVKVRFIGDLDGNGRVDILDVRLIAISFGSYLGHPRWNPDADLDQNNRIDILDIRLAAKNFGKQCST